MAQALCLKLCTLRVPCLRSSTPATNMGACQCQLAPALEPTDDVKANGDEVKVQLGDVAAQVDEVKEIVESKVEGLNGDVAAQVDEVKEIVESKGEGLKEAMENKETEATEYAENVVKDVAATENAAETSVI